MNRASWAPGWLVRIGWFALIWTAGVLALAMVALAVRVVMHAAGMKG